MTTRAGADRRLRVGLTYDLREHYLAQGYSELETAEFDRADTIDGIETALRELGYAVDRIGHVRQLAERLVAGDRWDLVFNICEGINGIGREAQVPALLDAYGIEYVFSGPLPCALTLHKGMSKDVVRAAGVRTPDYVLVREPGDVASVNLPYPLFAKPYAEGTGKGVDAASKVNDRSQLRSVCRRLLREYRQPVLVERFLCGREFTVGILGTGPAARALATLEVNLLEQADADAYSYRNKEDCESLVKYSLLEEGALRRSVEALALRAWGALECRDAGRVDVRLDEDGQANFIEVNPLAGIHPQHSDLPIMATMTGMTYTALIGEIMDSARLRLGRATKTHTLAA